MADRPQIQVNVPVRPNGESRNKGAAGLGRLSPDRALRFTPFAQSVIPLTDRIPIPQSARVKQNDKIATTQERAQAQKLFQQQNLAADIQNGLATLLSRPDVTL